MLKPDNTPQSTTSKTRREFLLRSAAAAAGISLARRAFALNEGRSNSPSVANAMSGHAGVIRPVNFSNVKITDEFWKTKVARIASATLPACILQTEVKTARIRNFEKVARKQGERTPCAHSTTRVRPILPKR